MIIDVTETQWDSKEINYLKHILASYAIKTK